MTRRISGQIGVAISTTGDEHRLGFLETCVTAWRKALPLGSVIVVTVDGDEQAHVRAGGVVDSAGPPGYVGGNTVRVGQGRPSRNGRQGVAVNKNTGIEYLRANGVEHLFLCDDDTWPLYTASVMKHIEFEYKHSMVCWGESRVDYTQASYAAWKWPRGVLLYAHRSVVETVGGMVEEFGPGGHEHVEWSRRIHQARVFTAEPYVTPASYAQPGPAGPATRASALWHCEDMPRPGERGGQFKVRKQANTSVRRTEDDWAEINKIMAERDGDTTFVPYTATENGRGSATLYTSHLRSGDA